MKRKLQRQSTSSNLGALQQPGPRWIHSLYSIRIHCFLVDVRMEVTDGHVAPVACISQEALLALELTPSGAEGEPPARGMVGSSPTPFPHCQVYLETFIPLVQIISTANV